MRDDEGVEFFNGLSGYLDIVLSPPPDRIAPNLLNLKAAPDAKIERISLALEVFEGDEARELTEAEVGSRHPSDPVDSHAGRRRAAGR